MIELKRNYPVGITPSVGEVAKLIWSMDSEEQAFLLQELNRLAFEESKGGYLQLACLAEDVKKRQSWKDIGRMVDLIQEYIGTKGLIEYESEKHIVGQAFNPDKAESEDT